MNEAGLCNKLVVLHADMTMMSLFQLEHSLYFLFLLLLICVLKYIGLCQASKQVELFEFDTMHQSVYDVLLHS